MQPPKQQLFELIAAAQRIVIIQADNPDADSLGSALALESLLSDMHKSTYLYCGVNIPEYLHYLTGWSRVVQALPATFDLSILVDASTLTLLETCSKDPNYQTMLHQPFIVLDHHKTTDDSISFATEQIIQGDCSSTGELLYNLWQEAGQPIGLEAQSLMLSAVLGDTQGLSNQLTSPSTYHMVGTIIANGVDRGELEEARRAYQKMPEKIYRYKGQLIERTEFFHDAQLALVTIPQAEITEYSPLYNPGPLIIGDMLQTINVRLAVVVKYYADGHVTGAIRANPGSPLAAPLAAMFGGGGHDYAAGFKIPTAESIDSVVRSLTQKAGELFISHDNGS